MSEIEKYYNGEIHVDFDDEIEELKADIEEYRDSTTWWSNRFNALERDNRELRKEIERLHNIIKEVREYIKDNKIYTNEKQEAYTLKNTWYGLEILGILDKENK